MTSKGRFIVSAAVMTIGTFAMAAAGGGGGASPGGGASGASGGASGGGAGLSGGASTPSAIINDGDAATGPGTGLTGNQPAATSLQGTAGASDAGAKPPIEVRAPGGRDVDNDRATPPDPAPRTLPRVSQPLPPAGTVTGSSGRIDTSPGSGGVTSSSGSTTDTQTQTAPGTAAPGTPPVVGAPSGFLQNRAAQLQQQQQQQQQPGQQGTQIRGGFGSTDVSVDASTGTGTDAGVDESQIDVTRRTQQMTRELEARPAGSQLPAQGPPSASPPIQIQGQQDQPGQQGQQLPQRPQEQRPDIPMPPSPNQGPGQTR